MSVSCIDAASVSLHELRARRTLVAALAATALAPRAFAQARSAAKVGLLLPLPQNPNEQQLVDVFRQELATLGWNQGVNLQLDVQWSAGGIKDVDSAADKVVASSPDVLVAFAGAALGPLMLRTSRIPIVFTAVADPSGGGFVRNYAHPEGNATGFTSFDNAIGAKWLQLLRELSPGMKRVDVLGENRAPDRLTSGTGQYASVVAAAKAARIAPAYHVITDKASLDAQLQALVPGLQTGLLVTSGPLTARYRDDIVRVAAEKRIPAVYFDRSFVARGGLVSYGADRAELYRRAAGYVDRILHGQPVSSLPVQSPMKYDLVLNRRAATALGIAIPESILIMAQVIE